MKTSVLNQNEKKKNEDLKGKLGHMIAREILEDIQNGLIIGASAYVEKDGEEVCRQTAGMADLTPSARKLTEKHLYRMASMTKPVIAVCVLLMVERGKMALEDEVAKFLPEFADLQVVELGEDGELTGTHPAPRRITILDLLTHTSGLGSGAWFASHYPDSLLPGEAVLADRMKVLSSSPLEFDPGTAFSYSATAGFDVLARLVEITSNLPIEEFLQKNLCEPLGMKNTTFNPSEEQMNCLTSMYASTPDGPRKAQFGNHIFDTHPRTYHSGGAGLVSCLDDYILFARMLLEEGTVRKKDGTSFQLLTPQSVRKMQTPWVHDLPGLGKGCAWGLSVRVVTENDASQKPLQKGAFGWSGAYGTHFWIDPVHRLFAVYMSNMTTAGGAGALTARHLERDVMEALEE